jgi:hypothetical protein
LVKANLFPAIERFRLAPGQVRLHRKPGSGKVQRRFIISCRHYWDDTARAAAAGTIRSR